MARVYIGTINWNHDQWNNAYYPDDIPDEWKLAYYANDFSAVVLPENLWRTEQIESVAEALEDIEESFAVYCLLETGSLIPREIAAVKSLLNPYFQGFVVKPSQGLAENNSNLADCIFPLTVKAGNTSARYWAKMPINTQQPLEVLFLSCDPDLKKIRNYFEQLRQQLEDDKTVLIVVTPADSREAPDVEFLQQLRTLLELMAIA